MAIVGKTKTQLEEERIAIKLSKEEVRVLHQALNEVCHGVDLNDSDFRTRMRTERSEAIILMQVLGHVYRTYH